MSNRSQQEPVAREANAGASGEAVTSQNNLTEMTQDMFDKVVCYLRGELEGTCDEYRLLESMNCAASQRYVDMQHVAENVGKSLKELNHKYENLRPYLDQIDEIDTGSRRMEEAAYILDNYVKNLETKFAYLQKHGAAFKHESSGANS